MINDKRFRRKCCSSKDRKDFRMYENFKIGEGADELATKIIGRNKEIDEGKQDM
jgi:hypothetical protein